MKSHHALCLIAIGLLFTSGCHLTYQDGYTFDYTGIQTKISTITPISSSIKELHIENKFGDVLITHDPSRPMECRWEGTVWADNEVLAEAFVSQLILTPIEDGELLTLTLAMPEHDSTLNGIESNLLINVPKTTLLNSTNAHGNTQLSHLDGETQIVNSHGNVSAKNMNVLNIECSHGDVTLANSMGETSIVSSHGNVTAANTKAITVDSRHTDILIQNALGEVNLTTTHGDVNVSHLQGFVAIDTSHGEINANSVAGQVIAQTTHADVNISGNCSSLAVDSTHGKIQATLANTDFQTIVLDTTHDDIVLTLPANANIDLKTDEKDLHNEFPSNPTGAPVELSVTHGEITVKAAK